MKTVLILFLITIATPIWAMQPHWITGKNKPIIRYFHHKNIPASIEIEKAPKQADEHIDYLEKFISNGPCKATDLDRVKNIARMYPPEKESLHVWVNLFLARAYYYHGHLLNPTDREKNRQEIRQRCLATHKGLPSYKAALEEDPTQPHFVITAWPEWVKNGVALLEELLANPDHSDIAYLLAPYELDDPSTWQNRDEDFKKIASFAGGYWRYINQCDRTQLLILRALFAHEYDPSVIKNIGEGIINDKYKQLDVNLKKKIQDFLALIGQ